MTRARHILLSVTLVVIALGLFREFYIAAHGEGTFLQEARHFDLDNENNLPSWWSSSLMLVVALTCVLFSFANQGRGLLHNTIWRPLALVFFFLSLDEAASFHEAMMVPIREMFGFDGLFYYAWVVPAFVCVTLFLVMVLRQLLALPRAVQVHFVVAGSLFMGGAVGMEMLGGALEQANLLDQPVYRASIVIEETLEFAGLTVFLLALLTLAQKHLRLADLDPQNQVSTSAP